jgi:hypothetical protein
MAGFLSLFSETGSGGKVEKSFVIIGLTVAIRRPSWKTLFPSRAEKRRGADFI